jgi:hypothetical protein
LVYSANRYLTKEEMTVNAQYIMDDLLSKGWTKNSVAGMLGNMETESTINPGIWQSLDENNMSVGFGLVQWTPASKYTDWADANGYAWGDISGQLARLQYEIDNNIQWISTTEYPMTFAEFKVSTETPEYLADVFITNYERPADPNQPIRGTQARYWFDNLTGDGSSSGYQLALLPIKYLNVTQGENGSFSHQGSWAMDFDGPTDAYPYYAPCDAECIQRNDAEAILVWKSQKEVMCADGQIRQIVWRCIHDDVLDFNVGDKILKNDFMGNTGNGGNSSGDHLHLDVWLGTTYNGSNPLHIYDVFAINGVEVVNDGGYAWKTSDYVDGTPTGDSGSNSSKNVVALLLSNALNGWYR